MRKWYIWGTLFIISIIAFYVYYTHRVPEGISTKGDDELIAYISLAGGLFSLLGGIIGMVAAVVSSRKQ